MIRLIFLLHLKAYGTLAMHRPLRLLGRLGLVMAQLSFA